LESHYRSIVKAITWRAGGTVVTFAVAWVIKVHCPAVQGHVISKIKSI